MHHLMVGGFSNTMVPGHNDQVSAIPPIFSQMYLVFHNHTWCVREFFRQQRIVTCETPGVVTQGQHRHCTPERFIIDEIDRLRVPCCACWLDLIAYIGIPHASGLGITLAICGWSLFWGGSIECRIVRSHCQKFSKVSAYRLGKLKFENLPGGRIHHVVACMQKPADWSLLASTAHFSILHPLVWEVKALLSLLSLKHPVWWGRKLSESTINSHPYMCRRYKTTIKARESNEHALSIPTLVSLLDQSTLLTPVTTSLTLVYSIFHWSRVHLS